VPRPGINYTLPASQPPPHRPQFRPDPGTPTRASVQGVHAHRSMTANSERGAKGETSPACSHSPEAKFNGSLHSNDLFVAAQQSVQNVSGREAPSVRGSMSSPEWGSPLKGQPPAAASSDDILFGRYNDLYSSGDEEELPEFVA